MVAKLMTRLPSLVHTRNRFPRRTLGTLCLIAAMSWLTPAFAATYYVDPDSGANTNNGTSPSTPWQNPPGTRTANNGGFSSPSVKVQCGDVILLKGGNQSTKGGAWRIDANYYTNNCTSGARITLRIATSAEWSGSSGNFTIDGTGITGTCVNFCGSGGYVALVDVEGVNYVVLQGQSATQRLEIKNTARGPNNELGMGLLVSNGFGSQGDGFKGQWLSVHNNAGVGIEIAAWKNWLVANTVSYNNGAPGFGVGGQSDLKVTNGGFVDTEAYGNGTNGDVYFADAYFFIGGNPLWCVRCTSHDNAVRGFNTGSIQNNNNGLYLFRDVRAYNNGTSTDPNASKNGMGFSGTDLLDQYPQQNFIVGAILYRNTQLGLWMGYGDGWVELWHGTFFGNGYGTNPDGDTKYDRSSDYAGVYNSIYQRRSYTMSPWSYGNANIARDRAPRSDYNLYHPASADSEPFANFNFQGGSFNSTSITFAQAASGQGGFTGAHELIGATYDPRFVKTDDTTYANNDFHLQSGSAAIGKGQFLMRANGGGSNATTINVLGNGNSNDPRNYFIASNSYLDATPDTIQIQGCGQVTITALTATSISFTPACSWANGAGVHLPWSGTAPDMGAYGYGASTSTVSALPAPTNLRIAQ